MLSGYARQRSRKPFLLGLLAIALCALLVTASRQAHGETASVKIGGPFSLVAADGSAVTDKTYRGKWLLVFFGYTYCPDICPTTLNEIAGALDRLGPAVARLQPLFITVDPARDTPKVIGAYTAAFDARIVGLTGSPEEIAAVEKEYGAYGVKRSEGATASDYLMDHGTYIYLMDPQGQFVQGFDAGTSAASLAETIGDFMRKEGS